MGKFLVLFLSFGAYAETIRGEWIRGRKQDYRYVTEYEVKTTERPFPGVPWIEQDCHDEGTRFASWSKTVAYEIVYSGGVSFDLLGIGVDLGGERSRTVSMSFQRWVTPEPGLRARHVLHESFQNWIGTTHVEFLGADGEITRGNKTYPFRLTNMNYGLFVKREVLERCGNE